MPMEDNSLYSRQKSLLLKQYTHAIVIGAGGIGNWVALDLALSGLISNLIIIDPDVVEESNLNRTFFDYSDIGSYKVDAVAKHIMLRRPEQRVQIFREYMNDDLADVFIKMIFDGDNSYYHAGIVIVDCRDDVYEDCYKLNCKLYKVGYDGMNISIDGNPRLTKVFGQRGGSYSVTPSYIGSAQLSAILVCNDILYPKSYRMYDDRKKINPMEINKNSESEEYPYIQKRACYEHDEHGRLNDVINMNCTDIIGKFVTEKHEYIIPCNDFTNLPNLV